MTRVLRALPVLALATAALAGCGSSPSGSAAPASAQPSSGAAGASSSAFPVELTSCGRKLTLPSRPQRVVVVNDDAFPVLDAIGAADSVVARVGTLPEKGVWPDALQASAEKVPALASTKNATGGSVVSSEALLAAKPDLVVGAASAVESGTLEKAGIPLYVPPAFCDAHPFTGHATFDLVYTEVRAFGTMFGAADAAQKAVADLQAQVKGISPAPAGTTAAALYVAPGGATVYAYGQPSLNQAIFDANGVKNVYEASTQRVFEISQEDLLAKHPKVLVLLYGDGSAEQALSTFRATKIGAAVGALGDVKLVPMPFQHTDPATPQTVVGARELSAKIAGS